MNKIWTLILFAVFCFLVITLNSNIAYYIDIPSFQYVVASLGLFLLLTGRVKDYLHALKVLYWRNDSTDYAKIERSLETLILTERASFWLGLIGVLICAVSVLNDYYNSMHIGISISTGFLICLYFSINVILVIIPGKTQLSKILERKS